MGVYGRILRNMGFRSNRMKFRRRANPRKEESCDLKNTSDPSAVESLRQLEHDRCNQMTTESRPHTGVTQCAHPVPTTIEVSPAEVAHEITDENQAASASNTTRKFSLKRFMSSSLRLSFNKGRKRVISAVNSVHRPRRSVTRKPSDDGCDGSLERSGSPQLEVIPTSESIGGDTRSCCNLDDTVPEEDREQIDRHPNSIVCSNSSKIVEAYEESPSIAMGDGLLTGGQSVLRRLPRQFLAHLDQLTDDKVIMAMAVKCRLNGVKPRCCSGNNGCEEKRKRMWMQRQRRHCDDFKIYGKYDSGDVAETKRAFDFYFPGHVEQLHDLAKDKTYNIVMI